MSNRSTNLDLPFLQQAQAQKHVTLNESLLRLDALTQLTVESATNAAQPGAPPDGALYILPAGKSGVDWGSMSNGALAYFRDGVWEQITPREGWRAFVKDTDLLLSHNGAEWVLSPATKSLWVSAADKMLGRATAGSGAAEEITCTAAGRALIDDADAAAQRVTLGLGNLATKSDSASVTWSGLPIIAMTANPALRIVGANAEFRWRTDESTSGYMITASIDNTGAYWESNSGARGFRWRAAGATLLSVDGAGALVVHGHVTPSADNALNLGSASYRFAAVFAGSGAISTSDADEKTALKPLPESAKRAVRRLLGQIGVSQFLSSRTAKGDRARFHVGVTAQAVRDAFLAEGEDPGRWALFCADPVYEEVQVEEETEELAPVTREAEAYELTHEPGRAVRKRVTQVQEVRDVVPLVDEDGAPVLDQGRPVLVDRPRLELRRIKRARSEIRTVLDAGGAQRMRLGVRYDQLFALALAAMTDDALG